MLMAINIFYPLTIYWLRGVFLLVFNVVKEEVSYEKSVFGRRKTKTFQPDRFNVYLDNKIYNIVNLTKNNINDKSVRRILEINRNSVLKCNCNDINSQISEYLMDITPYMKRAILSSVIKELEQGFVFQSLCIKDSCFAEADEYYSLARKLRRFAIVCDDNKEFNNFRNRCYNNLGLNIECLNQSNECYAYLDLDNIIMDKSAFMTINNNQVLIYADEGYFNVDKNVSELLKYEVPKEYACASLYM